MLGGFAAVGIGHVVCDGVDYWVQEFSSPLLDAKKTAAADSKETVNLSIAKSLVVGREAQPDPASVSLEIGESAPLPAMQAAVKLEEGWLWVPVEAPSSGWTSSDPSVASIENGRVVGVKPGSSTLSTTVSLDSPVSVSVPVTVKKKGVSISGAEVALVKTSFPYTGKAQKGEVESVVLEGKTLKAGTDYTIRHSKASPKDVGVYKVTVTGKGAYAGEATATFKIVKATNTVKPAKLKVTKSIKASALKKKAQVVGLPKVKSKFGKATWRVAPKGKDKKGALTLKSGKVQVKKGAKKGAYTIKLQAFVKESKNYNAATSKVVTVKVTVK
jgi:hypothetical protein